MEVEEDPAASEEKKDRLLISPCPSMHSSGLGQPHLAHCVLGKLPGVFRAQIGNFG